MQEEKPQFDKFRKSIKRAARIDALIDGNESPLRHRRLSNVSGVSNESTVSLASVFSVKGKNMNLPPLPPKIPSYKSDQHKWVPIYARQCHWFH